MGCNGGGLKATGHFELHIVLTDGGCVTAAHEWGALCGAICAVHGLMRLGVEVSLRWQRHGSWIARRWRQTQGLEIGRRCRWFGHGRVRWELVLLMGCNGGGLKATGHFELHIVLTDGGCVSAAHEWGALCGAVDHLGIPSLWLEAVQRLKIPAGLKKTCKSLNNACRVRITSITNYYAVLPFITPCYGKLWPITVVTAISLRSLDPAFNPHGG